MNLSFVSRNSLIISIVIILLVVIVVRSFTFSSQSINTVPITDIDFDQHATAVRLADVLRLQTISLENAPVAAEAFTAMHTYLERVFPLTHQVLEREIVNKYISQPHCCCMLIEICI